MLRAFLLIVVGLAGDPEHGELFQKWGSALAEVSESVGVASDRLVYLSDAKEDARVHARATREEINKALSGFAQAAAPDDVVYVVLVGHGSYDGRTARFNLPGPDMTPADFNTLLKKLPTRNVVFVNTSSSSGPFVEELSAPGRTIITATRNGAERFTTLFGGYFVEAFSTAAADADKNNRLSMLEAFQYATSEVARAYERDGLTFSDPVPADGALTVEDDRGRRWEVDEEALVLLEDRSQRLVRLESRISYWFGWFQFHPTTSVHGP